MQLGEKLTKSTKTANLLADDLRAAHHAAYASAPPLALHLEDLILQAEKLRQRLERVRISYTQEVVV